MKCKRMAIGLLAAWLAIAGMPLKWGHGGTAQAADPESYFTFDPSTGTIESYNVIGQLDVVIPEEIGGTTVKAIGEGAFINKNIRSVVIPNSVEAIGDRAFKSNSLTSVALPESLVTIGSEAFEDNKLTSLVIPNQVKEIAARAFRSNELTTVDIPDGVEAIRDHAFSNNNLTAVHLPDSVTTIENRAFSNNEIASVTLPAHIEAIDPGVFRQNQITSLTIPSSVKTIGEEAFWLNQLATITLPEGLASIGNSAFGNNKLTSVVIPDSVVSIGESVFSHNHLVSVTLPSKLEVIPRNAFATNLLTTIVLPDSIKTIEDYAFNKNQLTEAALPDHLETIGSNAFTENELTEVVLPESLTSVGNSAFSKNQISSLAFPATAVSFGTSVFSDNKLTHIAIPSWMNSIPNSLFLSNQLTSLTLPDTVQEIGSSVFRGNMLTTVDLPDSLETIGSNAFSDNDLTSLTLPASVTTVGRAAFSLNELTSVTILGESTNIGISAFASNALTTVMFAGGGGVIENNAFANNQLNEADLYIIAPGGSKAHTYALANKHSFIDIDSHLFTVDAATGDITSYNDAYGLEKVIVPSELSGVVVTGIGDQVFHSTKNVKSVYLPDTITRLAATSFTLSSVTEVRLPAGLPEIRTGTFASSKLTSVTIPGSVKTIGENAFYNAQLQQLVLSEGIETIRAAAFGNNPLEKVLLPFSMKEVQPGAFYQNELKEAVVLNKETIVQEGAFEGNSSGLVMYGHPGSHAEAYAADHQLLFKPLAELSQTGAHSFADAVFGYGPVAPLTVTVTRRFPGTLDNLEVTLSGTNPDAFDLGPLGAALLDDATAETQFTVWPKAGLAAGAYHAVVTLHADYELGLSFHVSFKVARPDSDDSDDTPAAPGGGTPPASEEDASEAQSEAPEEDGVDIFVNGSAESIGTATVSDVNGRKATTITIADDKLRQRLDREGAGAVIGISAAGSDIVAGELNGLLVKHMEQRQAVLDIRTDRATYTLPAQLIDIDAVSERFGTNLELQDIKIRIEIAVPTGETAAMVENAASARGLALVAPPLSFSVKAVYGERVEEIERFHAYVERTVAIPEGVDPTRITTGVVVEQDGTVRHVPTKVIVIDGHYHARMNSLSNSAYAVVWNPLEFGDVAQHWARSAVNDMGSRMVIEGTGNGMFDPDRGISRAEFAAILVRGLGLGHDHGATPFSDVAASDWYSGAIHTAYAYRLISGFEDGTFRPNSNITREEAMLVLSKAMVVTGLKDKLSGQSTEDALRPFGDAASVSAWARSGVADVVHAGIVSGRSADALVPQGTMTRAEVAVVIRKLLQTSGLI